MASQFNLRSYNTFGIEAIAQSFAEIKSIEDLRNILKHNKLPLFILGGGSNILFTKDYYPWLFIKNDIQGIEIKEDGRVAKDEGQVHIQVGGGVVWHELVMWCVSHGLGGIENLSLIPGTVGAAPIQNIGAYGVELKDVFVSLEAMDLKTMEVKTFTALDCAFGYRESFFKRAENKGRYFIASVVLALERHSKVHTGYGDIQKTLLEMRVLGEPSIAEVSEAVIRIRRSKLPDPEVIGNAGSFFKNPEIGIAQFEDLKKWNPNLPGYPVGEGMMKVPAGWLIEQCGWKGKRVGEVGCHERQALVLVNYGGGKGSDILSLAGEIIRSVEARLGIRLQAEVNIV